MTSQSTTVHTAAKTCTWLGLAGMTYYGYKLVKDSFVDAAIMLSFAGLTYCFHQAGKNYKLQNITDYGKEVSNQVWAGVPKVVNTAGNLLNIMKKADKQSHFNEISKIVEDGLGKGAANALKDPLK